MTDPATPSIAPDAAPIGGRSRYGRERALVGAVFLTITVGVIVNGAVRIHQDTFRSPSEPTTFPSCSAGVRDLHAAFVAVLRTNRPVVPGGDPQPYRPSADPVARAALATLDDRLSALRVRCAAEGPRALDAYESLTLWRYRAQDLARMAERVLVPGAERALRFHSAGDPGRETPSGSIYDR